MKHILCAIDLAHIEAEQAILNTAAELAKYHRATLSVVTVVPDYGMSIVGAFFKEGTMKSAVVSTNRQLHALVKEVLPFVDNVQHIVEVGTVYERVLATIERTNADLVVIGAHKPELTDRLQGPNSARVSRYADCSVYVVR